MLNQFIQFIGFFFVIMGGVGILVSYKEGLVDGSKNLIFTIFLALGLTILI